MAALTYSQFLGKFPTVKFNVNPDGYPQYENVTNIFFRIGLIRDVLTNISSYYVYELGDGDTPESLAEQVYGDAGAHWMILYANEMFDPQFDWPMSYEAFKNYIVEKYGSLEWAKTNIHHYEMRIVKTVEPDRVTSETRFVVDRTHLTDQDLDVPYDYYQGGNNALSFTQTVETFNFDGKTITQVTDGEAISYYDWENQINEKKRLVKVIKAEYYAQVMNELKNLTDPYTIGYRRTVR